MRQFWNIELRADNQSQIHMTLPLARMSNNNSYSIEVNKSSNISSDNDTDAMTNIEDSLSNEDNKKENKTLVPLLECMVFK